MQAHQIHKSPKNKHYPWIEKYRPTTLKDIKGQEQSIALFQEMLTSNRPLHFLFYGPPGTGKTSAVTSFCNELYSEVNKEQYILSINASYDRGIDMVRNKIKPFCKKSTTPFMRNGHHIHYKFVILDEADTLTKDAQNALRRCIEIYSYNTRFCFMCNYVCNVITPILSRCSVCHFKPVYKPIAIAFLQHVCGEEDVECDHSLLELVYDKKNGDLRACLTVLQAVCNMHKAITIEHLNEHLQIIPDSIWQQIESTKHYKECHQIVDKLYNSGYSLRALMMSFIPWALAHLDTNQMYKVAPLLSRLEIQMMKCVDTRLLLHEFVATIWETILTS